MTARVFLESPYTISEPLIKLLCYSVHQFRQTVRSGTVALVPRVEVQTIKVKHETGYRVNSLDIED
jgi:hypothetical protein